MKKLLTLFLVSFLLLGFTSAHQPRIVFGHTNAEINPIVVNNPEISQAFYGNLAGSPDYYTIYQATGFQLYVNIVVPQQTGQRTDFIVDIIQGNNPVYTRMDGNKVPWTPFYEEFAGDNYLKGPEREQQVQAGQYVIKVSNTDNQGKYSLAIGKTEAFPPKEMLNAMYQIPILKVQFFNKPRWSIGEGIIGMWLQRVLGGIIVLIVLLLIIRKLWKK